MYLIYGGMERTQEDDGFQLYFQEVRSGSRNTAAAIAEGARLDGSTPRFVSSCNQNISPDAPPLVHWPAKPTAFDARQMRLEAAASTVFHTLPAEVLLHILPLLHLPDLLSILLTSHGHLGLVDPLLDEVLWHHVHHADLRWLLPVASVPGEVDRANQATMEWYPAAKQNQSTLTCVLDSRDFPFSQFLSEYFKSNSMRNRKRLWQGISTV
ncbi:hypothetical protein DFH09DRAFT_1082634 [Mycena vulgaris]|nr:hypothetical protein DFH09DRAFT_1082634 [Mycena vulgaris]